MANKDIEHETQYTEITPEQLAIYNWRLTPQPKGHRFTIIVPQGVDPDEALKSGAHLYAVHEIITVIGGKSIPGTHREKLKIQWENGKEIALTVYERTIGHGPYRVMRRAS